VGLKTGRRKERYRYVSSVAPARKQDEMKIGLLGISYYHKVERQSNRHKIVDQLMSTIHSHKSVAE